VLGDVDDSERALVRDLLVPLIVIIISMHRELPQWCNRIAVCTVEVFTRNVHAHSEWFVAAVLAKPLTTV